MGTSTSRVTDVGVGICCCHPPIPCIPTIGALVTGAMSVENENFATSRVSDIIVHACGHVGIMVTGASTVENENFATSRIGDVYAACVVGVLITGAGTVDDQ